MLLHIHSEKCPKHNIPETPRLGSRPRGLHFSHADGGTNLFISCYSISAAKEYWEKLYGEYGAALVRDIPRRIKAALADNKKVASFDETAVVRPFAHAKVDGGLFIEGFYSSNGDKLLFRASLDSNGSVVDVQTIEL